jgi:hypothetical protein
MTDDDGGLDARVAAVEAKAERVRLDAQAARHLAAAVDRDLVDLGVKVDANQEAIQGLSRQTAERFDRMDQRFDRVDEQLDAQRWALNELTVQTADRFADLRAEMRAGFEKSDRGFAGMRAKLDQTAGGLLHLAERIDVLIARGSGTGGQG